MTDPDVSDPRRATDFDAIAALCQEALRRLGPQGHFRLRVLLEMTIIQLAVEARGREAQRRDAAMAG